MKSWTAFQNFFGHVSKKFKLDMPKLNSDNDCHKKYQLLLSKLV